MLAKAITLGTLIAGTLLAIVLTTVPLSAGPVGILAVFFLLYVCLVGLFAWSAYGANRLIRFVLKSMSFRKPVQKITLLHSYYLASILALGPVMLLGMNTVSKVGLYDALLVLLFLAIGVFYVQKRVN